MDKFFKTNENNYHFIGDYEYHETWESDPDVVAAFCKQFRLDNQAVTEFLNTHDWVLREAVRTVAAKGKDGDIYGSTVIDITSADRCGWCNHTLWSSFEGRDKCTRCEKVPKHECVVECDCEAREGEGRLCFACFCEMTGRDEKGNKVAK